MANCQKCIDINTASVEELQTLPGIGHCRAEAIVQARTKMGRFENIEDLKKVNGITSSILQKNSSHLTCRKHLHRAPLSSGCVSRRDNSRMTRSLTAAKAARRRQTSATSAAAFYSPYWMRHPRTISANANSAASGIAATVTSGGSDESAVVLSDNGSFGPSATVSHSCDSSVDMATISHPCVHSADNHCDSTQRSQPAASVVSCSSSRKPVGSETTCALTESGVGQSSADSTFGDRRPHCSGGVECYPCATSSADHLKVSSASANCPCSRIPASHCVSRPWMKLLDPDSHSQIESERPHTDSETACHDPSKSPVYRKQRIPSRNNPPPLMSQWLTTFQGWSHAERLLALDELISLCDASQVRHVMQVIEPQFQRDFISFLPKELALHVLSYLEPRDLARASQTCHYWHILAEDNLLWREKCREEGLSDAMVWGGRITRRRSQSRLICSPSTASMKTSWKNVYKRQKLIENNWSRSTLQPPKVLKGHDDHVITCLEFCGNKIVSGSDDNTLKVWSAVNGKCLRTLVGHTGGVWSSQMSGNTVISGSTDRTVKVWNADSGQCVFTLYGHTSTVRCMHLHETRLVSGSRDATLRVWDIQSGLCLHVLIGHVAAVRCVQYDGRRVVSGAYDYMVKIWDPESETCLQTLSGHTNRVYSLQFDGFHIVSGSLDTSIRVWSAETGACLHTLIGHQSLTSGMELRDNILVSGNADSTVKVWNITTGQCLQTLQGTNKHQSAVTCLQFNRRFVVTSSDDGTVKIWDLRTGEFLRNLVALESGGSGGVVWRIRCSNSRLVCAVGSRNGTEETKLLVLDFDVDDDISASYS